MSPAIHTELMSYLQALEILFVAENIYLHEFYSRYL